MADSKITALTALTAADPVNDMFPIVDVSDTTMAASGTTKKISVNNILGASGTATLASATITGALTVDTTTLVVDATNDRVGIGTASPTVPLHVIKDGVASGAGWTSIGRLTNVAATKGVDLGYNPANNNAVITALSGGTASGFEFWSLDGSWANRATLNSAGLYVTNGNVVMSTSGKGIDFSAVTGGTGTATANVLNDYEEGTFTPTIGGTATYTVQNGRYTKIGNRVFVTIRLTVLLVGTGSSSVISGLPFTVSTNPCPVSVGYFANSAISVYYLSGFADSGTSTINMTATTAATATISNGAAVIGNGTDLAISLVYYV